MIRRFSEPVLVSSVLILTLISTCAYMIIALIPWGIHPKKDYGVLPTFALGSVATNDHVFMSLFFFLIAALLETVVLAYLMEKVREIRKEFSMLTELIIFSLIWLTITNLTLFLIVQGIHSGWYTNDSSTVYRIFYWFYVLRSAAVSFYCSLGPIYDTYVVKDDDVRVFFPIPPNRECIETFDLVLHVPTAVDFFYNYLQSLTQRLGDK